MDEPAAAAAATAAVAARTVIVIASEPRKLDAGPRSIKRKELSNPRADS